MLKKSESLRRLEELIDTRRSLSDIVYEGGAQGHALYKGKDAAIQRAFLPAGTKFPKHSHDVTEIIVVISGKFHTESAFIALDLEQAGLVVYPPRVEHFHCAQTDSWVIGILIPCNGGYPDAK